MKNLVKQWQHLLQNRTPNGVATAGSTISPSAPLPAPASIPTPAPLPTPTASNFSPLRTAQSPNPTVNRTKVQQMLSKLKRGPQQASQTAAPPPVPLTSDLDSLSNSVSNSPLQASKSPSPVPPVPPSNGPSSEGHSSTLTLSFPLNSCVPRQRAPVVARKKVNSLLVKIPRQHLRLSRTDGSLTGTRMSSLETKCTTSAVHGLPSPPTHPLSLLVSIDTSLLSEASSHTHLPLPSHTHIPLSSKNLTQRGCTQALNGLAPITPELDSSSPHLKPTGQVPGMDGCLGHDGFWYDWTKPLPSEGLSVIVLPYVYIDGLEPIDLL